MGQPKDNSGDARMGVFRRRRMRHWDRVSGSKADPKRPGRFYHGMLQHYFRFLIPPGQRVLELGCGCGDLLAALKPAVGVGVDFSREMLRQAAARHPHLYFVAADVHAPALRSTFDVVVVSDLLNDIWDVQSVLAGAAELCHDRTRLVVNFFNNLWRLPLAAARRCGWGHDVLEQNWFAPQDVLNLLDLTGFEVVKSFSAILLPLQIPVLSRLANRYMAHLPPFKWFTLTNFMLARRSPGSPSPGISAPSVSVVVPARNEAGNIEHILRRMPTLGSGTEIVFVEGHSKDDTLSAISSAIARFPECSCCCLQQPGRGKGDAVRWGFEKASGDILVILDADLTVPPEDLPRFVSALTSGKGEFVNGVRLVYPMEDRSMRFLNMVGNKFFSLVFTWLLGQPIKDTLCGTKVLWRDDYGRIAQNRSYFGPFDPFGDFDLLFGAAKLNLKIVEVPIRYRSRTYGETNIHRWRHGWLLLKMAAVAARRIKFI